MGHKGHPRETIHPYADGRRSVAYRSITRSTAGLIVAQGNDPLGGRQAEGSLLPVTTARERPSTSPRGPLSPSAPPLLVGRSIRVRSLTLPAYFDRSRVHGRGLENSPVPRNSVGRLASGRSVLPPGQGQCLSRPRDALSADERS